MGRSLNGPTSLDGAFLNDGADLQESHQAERGTVFPVAMLPPAIRAFVEAVAEALPVPPDLVALPSLVAAGAAIGNTRRIRL